MIKTETYKTQATRENPLSSCLSSSVYHKNDSRTSYQQPTSPLYESLIDKINKKILKNEKWYSLEFFPPKTQQGDSNLISK